MEMTRERISFTFDPRDMLLFLLIGFSFIKAEVACSILERTPCLDPSSETTALRYLKCVTVPSFCPFYLDLPLDVIGAVCHQFSLLSTDLHLIPCARLARLSTRASSSCSTSARASLSSANCRYVIFLPPMLTFRHDLPEHQTR